MKINIKLILFVIGFFGFYNISNAISYIDSANKLAESGVIKDNSANTDEYKIYDNITRGEMAKIVVNLSKIPLNQDCKGLYSDLKDSSDWRCKYAESGNSSGFFALNDLFRPDDNITKIEALKMIMKARGLEAYSNDDWKIGYIEAAVNYKLLEKTFTENEYDEYAIRGWIFELASKEVINNSNLTITIIGDKRCDEDKCPSSETLSSLFEQIDFLSGAKIISKDYSDAGVEDYIKSVGIKTLPAIIFSNNNIDDSSEDEGNKITTYLTKLNDGQYSLDIGSEFDPFTPRSDKGYLILDKNKYNEILANLYVDGNQNAKITILEYSDIECPYCARLYTDGTISKIKENYKNDVNIYFNHFPLSFHENAFSGALILECLRESAGIKAFYNLIENTFESGNSSSDYLISEAVKLGGNKNSITKCLNDGKYNEKVTKIQDLGADTFNINGTPSCVIINNYTLEYTILSGAYPYDSFEKEIDRMLE